MIAALVIFAALLLIGLMGFLKTIERRERAKERAERDCQLAAVKLAGRDRNRTSEI